MQNLFETKTKLLLLVMAVSLTACGMAPPTPTNTLGTTDTTAKVDNSPQPTESGCAQEGHIKSPGSYNAATVTFDNQTGADLKVYWLDFNGKRKFYSDLKAHSKLDQATWIGHVWVVANASGQCVNLESANAVKQTDVIN